MKLEQTSLAEVIAAEEGNEQYRDLCALSHGQAPSLLGNKDSVPTAKDTELPERMDILSNKGSEAKSEVRITIWIMNLTKFITEIFNSENDSVIII